ncbi:hypothetical protein PPERSA_09649 [Pseudocohnilembus persalinus]|uniref:EF-hand domain-containing protein n=1 Tax=Pseudocohnilembus persalinus TaxID=266149 RepID=A0A0V0R707_PSEPJ|nr:hypothetical protein PPERSA_09649 [Pseudocohnilembus persalinus]|eukprot:KRX10265.1 hypothetical protein PPERSA_09649 [Pseudocohnilembus persalinus]
MKINSKLNKNKSQAYTDDSIKIQKQNESLLSLGQKGLFKDYHFFQQKNGKIQGDYDTCNHIFQTVNDSKFGKYKNTEEQIKYDDKTQQKINLNDIKQKINIIDTNYAKNDVHLLFPGKQELSSKEFSEFIQQNQIKDIDPIKECIALFNDGKNNFDFQRMQQFLEEFGFGKLENIELQILKQIFSLGQQNQTEASLKNVQQIFNENTYNLIQQQNEQQKNKIE